MDKVIVVPRTVNVVSPRCCGKGFSVSTPLTGWVGAGRAGPGRIHADGRPGVRGGDVSSEVGQPQGAMAGCRSRLASTLSPKSHCYVPPLRPLVLASFQGDLFHLTDVLSPACQWEGREQAMASLSFTGLRCFRDVFP